MKVTVTIPDEFVAQVKARGLTPERYIEELIVEQTDELRASGRVSELSLDEFNASLNSLARYSGKIPSLPIAAFSRESFYEDQD